MERYLESRAERIAQDIVRQKNVEFLVRRLIADREAFEAHAMAEGWSKSELFRSSEDSPYTWDQLNAMWRAWQARGAS